MACMVCKAWRSHALSLLIPDLEVCLNSGNRSSNSRSFGGRILCSMHLMAHWMTSKVNMVGSGNLGKT